MNGRGDSYRPDREMRNGPDRRGSTRPSAEERSGANDRSSWRREWPEDRRGRRTSNDFDRSERERGRSPTHVDAPKTPQRRARSNSAAAAKFDVSDTATGPNLLIRRSSTNGPRSALIATGLPSSLPSHRLSGINDLPTKPVHGPFPIDTQQHTKTVDPRLRSRSQQACIPQGMAASPLPASTEDGQDIQSQGWLTKEISNAVLGRNEKKKEYKYLSNKAEKIKEELYLAKKLFPKENPYVEKLNEELQTAEVAMKEKKEQIELFKRREESALRAFASQSKTYESLVTEVQALKGCLVEEQERSIQLRSSNDHLQQQITQLKTAVEDIRERTQKQASSSLPAQLQKQLDCLRKDCSERVVAEEQEILSIRSQVEEQKLGMTRLCETSVTRDSFSSLSVRVDTLEEQGSSQPAQLQLPSGNYVTKNDLEAYIEAFNTFQLKTNERFSNIEHKPKITPADMNEYVKSVDLDKHVQSRAIDRKAQLEVADRLAKVEATSYDLLNSMKTYAGKTGWIEKSLNLLSQQSNTIMKRTQNVESAQRLTQGTGAAEKDIQKLQTDMSAVQGTMQSLDRLVKSHSHSISSLNQRFNNLSTDQLCRQMVGLLEPMLATITPQVAEALSQLNDIQRQQSLLQAQQTEISSVVTNSNVQVSNLQGVVKRIEETDVHTSTKLSAFEEELREFAENIQTQQTLENKYQTLQKELASIRETLARSANKLQEDLEATLNPIRETVDTKVGDALAALNKSAILAIDKVKDEQSEIYTRLVDQVKDARDSIDARLIVVEKELSNRYNRTDTNIQSEKIVAQQRLGRSSSTRRAASPAVRSTTSTPATGSATKNSANKEPESNAKTSSMTKMPKFKPSQPSPVTKYFHSRSDADGEGDTIDATPKPRTNCFSRMARVETVSIPDSDQENETNDDEGNDLYADPLVQTGQVDLSLWKKPVKGNNMNGKGGAASPVETTPRVKRKRELSNAISKTSRASSSSGSGTPQSSGRGEKKPKT